MNKLTSLLIFSFLYIGHIHAQQTATISLQTLDQTDNQPLVASTVRLYQMPDSQLVAGLLTDEEGRCSFEGILPGNYQVIASYVGYQPVAQSILIGNLNQFYDLGKLALTPNEAQLAEVNIEAERSTVSTSLDKKSFNLSDNISQAGGSLLDAMRSLPGITVDAEGKVMLRGSDRVSILIDGKQSSLTGFGNQKGLENIPATNIERIEIINNPSAKYDASGMAGVINIIYKKDNQEGLNGELGLAFGLGELTTRKEDLPTDLGRFSVNPKFIPSLRLNYNKQKVRANFSAEILRQKRLPNNEFNTRNYEDGRSIISQVPENRTQTQYILNGGLDWLMDERNTLSFSVVWDYESHVDTAQVPYIDLKTQNRLRYWHWSEVEVTGYFNYRTNYEHKFKQPGHKLETSVQYTRGWEDEQYFLNDSSNVRVGNDTTHIIAIEHIGIFLLNYTKPLASGRLEAGSRIQVRRIPVDYTIGQGENSVLYPQVGTFSDWGEDIFAGYLNYIWEKPTYEIEAGLRAEQTQVFYSLDPVNTYYDQDDSYEYFQLYPNVRFTLKLNPRHGLSLFYNRRVDRPGEPELRVFPKVDDPELMKVGNPYLRPQFTQTFELAYRHSWEKGSLYFAGYYRLIDDPFTRVYSIDTSSAYNIVNRIYQNVGSGTQAGIEILASHQINPSWKISGSLNIYSNTIDAYSGTLLFPYERTFQIANTQANSWDIKINHELKLPADLQLQLTTLYYAPYNLPQGQQLSRASVDIGLKKPIFNNQGEVLFSFSDMFNQFGIRQELNSNGIDVLYENYYETQIARVGVKYKF